MARSFFPDLTGDTAQKTWAAAAAASGRDSVPRVAWLATALLAGVSSVLAVIFACLWWRGEIQEESVSRSLERLGMETARLNGGQSRQRRVFVRTKIDNAAQLAALTEESARLRKALEVSQTQAAAAESARGAAVAQLDQQAAEARQQTSSLQQVQFRAANLEQNLNLTQSDLNQRAAEHEKHVDSLQTNLISLRSVVTDREIEVRNITSAATQEIDLSRQATQEVAQEAEWLAAQLRTVSCERDQLLAEVGRLQQCLASERAANQSLAQRITHLECLIRQLESQPNSAPGSPANLPLGCVPVHTPILAGPGRAR